VRVVLANDYSGPGSGLSGDATIMPARVSTAGAVAAADPRVPAPSPILTAGSDKPECIN
jgi:hypothetical protein